MTWTAAEPTRRAQGDHKETAGQGAHQLGRRGRVRRLLQLLAWNTREFCRNTTLHGLRYILQQELFRYERAYFALSFVCVVVVSGFLSLNVYSKWSHTPIIVSINPDPTFIVSEPFPAVTVCNLNKAEKGKAEQYSQFTMQYAMLQMMCKREVSLKMASSISSWDNLNKFMKEIGQSCSSMLLRCQFGAKDYNCSEIFYPVITDEGLCCSFNMIHPDFMYRNSSVQTTITMPPTNLNTKAVEWSVETGYGNHNLRDDIYPRNALGTGEALGFSLTLDVQSESYYCSASNSIGFKILLHSPTERPAMREIGLLLAAGRETKVRISTHKTESEADVRGVRNRRCLFEDEYNLEIFRKYTQRNCVVECFVKMMIYFCGCVPHYLPKISGNETVCSIFDSTCLDRTYYELMITHAHSPNETHKGHGYSCNEQCLPSCFDFTFEADFFTSKLSHSGFQVTNRVLRNISSDYVERNVAVVNMYFKENSYRSNKQTQYIGATDFLASVGGLIGLFFGFSFISIAEFIFFFFIHPLCRDRRPGHTTPQPQTQPQPQPQPQPHSMAMALPSPPPQYSSLARPAGAGDSVEQIFRRHRLRRQMRRPVGPFAPHDDHLTSGAYILAPRPYDQYPYLP